ncbi:MAG: class I SAM-dependent methyltransferase [bacterium]|jgi:SAM-dependent methyltransferase|nr:class I SAM-dependent methyltransferase [bacterium]
MEAIEFVHSKTRQAYNLLADKYHELFHNEMNEKEYDRRLLDSFAEKLKPGSLICDAGCGPSGHIGRYIADRGMAVTGVDISDRCVELASSFNPGMRFLREDIAKLSFEDECFDGVISYYSIIHTPKNLVTLIFKELYRILKIEGHLLVAAKAGSEEGFLSELIGIETEIYFSLFNEKEIRDYFVSSGFEIEFMEKRNPFDFEIKNERIYAIGRKL